MNPFCPLRRLVVSAGLFATMALGAPPLDRGAIAFPTSDGGIYIGWRLLADDPLGITFDVYGSDRGDERGRKLNATPLSSSTHFTVAPSTDGRPPPRFYRVLASGGAAVARDSGPVTVHEMSEVGGLRRIKLQGSEQAQRVGFADLNGDGKLDFLVKHPNFNTDPYVLGKGYWKPSPESYKIDAYRHDGTFLWRYDMGPAIETGLWYSPILAYDLDGDGRAEVYCKAGPVDPAEIERHPDGMVTGGPEFLVKLDGATGRELARIPWPSRDGIKHRNTPSPLADYNYQSRNQLAVAYLDGKRPHLIVERGTYTLIKLRAYDADLRLVWKVDTSGELESYSGQGAHGIQVADVDDDGRDEVIIGAAAFDDDGRPLWNTGRGHPDACYVGKIDPTRPGLQVYLGHEWRQNRNGLCLVDARTGETIWGYAGPTTHIHSTGMVANIDPTRPGMECYGGEANGTQFWLYDARGTRIGNQPMGGLAPKAVWWDDSSTKLVIAGDRMFRFKPPTAADIAALQELTLRASASDIVRGLKQQTMPAKVNVRNLWDGYVGETLGTVEGNIIAIADFVGDWREEFIISMPGEIRIYSTTIPASRRHPTLMADRQYRTSVARQLMGYFYPPIPANLP